ncbi:MAG: stage II sporulation protein D [Peptococcaceae bacterium]|jgi:stage II sporulation protein D|nr:stage II sporulation protein D [Peptococcaceae bacterium]
MQKKQVWIIILFLAIVCGSWGMLQSQKKMHPGGEQLIRMLTQEGQVETVALEEYLTGVVAAEMPAVFHEEALKAQAIAARTFAVKAIRVARVTDPGYDVDTTTKTQAWVSDRQMYAKWGILDYWRYHHKIAAAVQATRQEVLVMDGACIDAVYFSSSGRKPTERAEEVWSASRPYLINVTSAETEPLRFVQRATFSAQEIYAKLKLIGTPKPLASQDFEVVSRTAAGRVKTLAILGKVYPATQIRTLFNLASTDWEGEVRDGQVTLTIYGNGHAVGMSQYGANDLAVQGYLYQDILGHFYPGAKIEHNQG